MRIFALPAVVPLGLAIAGCAAAPKAATHRYILAVRYDVEPVLVGRDRHEALDLVRDDFNTIAKLGFTSALLWHVDPLDRGELLELAGDAGITIFMPGPDAGFVRCEYSRGPLDPGTVIGTVVGEPPRWCKHPAFAGLVSGQAFGADPAGRPRTLSLAVDANRIPWVRRLGGSGGDGFPGWELTTIDTAGLQPDNEASLLQGYLARFHTGLAARRTAGLIVDRYRRTAGDPPGLTAAGQRFTPTESAAIKQLLIRARQWGPRLRELAARPLAVPGGGQADLKVTALTGQRRRYVLVFNSSADRYRRGEVRLPESIGKAPVVRAVEVPPSAGSPLGRVLDGQGGPITLPVTLRPGDAILFEVF